MFVIIGYFRKIVNAFGLDGNRRNELHAMAGALASLEGHL